MQFKKREKHGCHGRVLLLLKLLEISIFMLGCRDLLLLYPELCACGCFRSDAVLTSALGDVNDSIWFSFSGDLVVNVLPSLPLFRDCLCVQILRWKISCIWQMKLSKGYKYCWNLSQHYIRLKTFHILSSSCTGFSTHKICLNKLYHVE